MKRQMSFGLSGNQLKLIALALMTVDHIGMLLYPHIRLLRIIGRLAFPIFAYMIAEGCRHTKHKRRYIVTMAGFAAVCQLVYLLVAQSLSQCIFVTFLMSILLITAIDNARQQRTALAYVVAVFAVIAVIFVCEGLPRLLSHTDFSVDYGLFGVLLPPGIYLCSKKRSKLIAAAVILAIIAVRSVTIQWYALLALPLLALYNGKRGKYNIKYVFYMYYPLHLAALYLLTYIPDLFR